MSWVTEQIQQLGYELSETGLQRIGAPKPLTRASYKDHYYFFYEQRDGWIYWEDGQWDWSGNDDPGEFLAMLQETVQEINKRRT